MFSWLGRLFGTEKAAEKIIDTAANGLDKLIYTDEERAEAAASDRSEARKMVVQWMASTQGQNLARRVIALAITFAWLGAYGLGLVAGMVAVFVDDVGVVTSAKVLAVSDIARAGAMDMSPAVMLILAFYFAAPHMGDIAKAVTGRFTQSMNRG